MSLKSKHLKFTLKNIMRVEQNSFITKITSILFIGSLVIFDRMYSMDSEVFIAIALVIFLWVIDSSLSYRKELYRKHYDHIKTLPEDGADLLLENNTSLQKNDPLKFFFSKKIFAFYGILILIFLLFLG
ncbi:MAG: hypothetical protein PHC89_00235 [Candidatus Pacebacteria bacterium]|nr:hypothetical protein [Candidatus Paceibacterota bacterium]